MDKQKLKLFSNEKQRELKLMIDQDDILRVILFTAAQCKIVSMVVWANEHRGKFRWVDTNTEHPGFWLGRVCFEITPEEAKKISETFGFPLPQQEKVA